jgi:hypothetical protein
MYFVMTTVKASDKEEREIFIRTLLAEQYAREVGSIAKYTANTDARVQVTQVEPLGRDSNNYVYHLSLKAFISAHTSDVSPRPGTVFLPSHTT